MRGDVPGYCRLCPWWFRFSPRARGCSVKCNKRSGSSPVFPACAGMFRTSLEILIFRTSFPRVRGDVPSLMMFSLLNHSFSPRARGCSWWCQVEMIKTNVFPACAGMFRMASSSPGPWGGFPRVRGDVP